MGAILKDEPAPVSRLQPALPPQIDRVVQRCLAKDPDGRWQSVRDVVAELNWASHASEASASPSTAAGRSSPCRRTVAQLPFLPFNTGIVPTYNLDHYAPTAGGQRFLLRLPLSGGESSLLNVVVNWTAVLPKQ